LAVARSVMSCAMARARARQHGRQHQNEIRVFFSIGSSLGFLKIIDEPEQTRDRQRQRGE
jgi:hypothetical protein